MPKKTTKAGLIDRIVARLASIIDEVAQQDHFIARALMIQSLDRQNWEELSNGAPRTLLHTAPFDEHMGGALEQLFNEFEPWLPETSPEDKKSADVRPLLSDLSAERVPELSAALIDRLIERFLFPPRIDLESKPNDPADMRSVLQTMQRDQLERIVGALRQSIPDPKRSRPTKQFWHESLENLNFWYEVKTYMAKNGVKPAEACSKVANANKQWRSIKDDALLKRFSRTDALVELLVSLVSVGRRPDLLSEQNSS